MVNNWIIVDYGDMINYPEIYRIPSILVSYYNHDFTKIGGGGGGDSCLGETCLIRSDGLQDIISRPNHWIPKWILMYGNGAGVANQN